MDHYTKELKNYPEWLIKKWQGIADLLAEIIEIPAALIMKHYDDYMEVFISSKSAGNSYKPGDRDKWYGLYCQTVIQTQKELLIPNALKNPAWDKNPDIKLGMISYLGLPINYPDNTPFGTICVLDHKENPYSEQTRKLLLHFKSVLELDLGLVQSFELKDEESAKIISEQHEQIIKQNKQLKKAEKVASISQKKLEEKLHESELNKKRFESLLSIAQYQTDSLQELLDYALEQSIQLTESKIGYIYFYNEETRQFTLNTWSKEVMKECSVMNPETVYELDKTGIWGEAVRQRKAIVVNNYKAPDPKKKGVPEGHVRLKTFMTIPVFSGNKIVAVAGVANKEIAYNHADVRQMELLMDSVWKISEKTKLIDELSKAKEQIEESELQFRAIAEQSSEGITVADQDGKYVYVNSKFCDICGYSKDELLKMSVFDLRYNNTIEEAKQVYKKFKSYPAKKISVALKRKDGKKRLTEVAGSRVVINGVDLILGTISDVTQISKYQNDLIYAKERAEKSEERLNEAQKIAKMGNWEFEYPSQKLTWSDEIYDMTGLSPDEYEPSFEKFFDLVHPDDIDRVKEAYFNLLTFNQPGNIIHRIVLNDGSIKYVNEKYYLSFADDDIPEKSIGTVTDVTEMVLAENELKRAKERAEESERKLIQSQEMAKLGSWELNTQTDTYTLTDSFYSILHTSVEEMGGYEMSMKDYFRNFLDPDFIPAIIKIKSKFMTTNDPNFTLHFEHKIRYADEGEGYIGVKLFVSKDKDGKTDKVYGIAQDITEKKKSELELIKAKEKAEESDRLKSAFLANMSHEIRTPMNGILGFSSLLKEPGLSGENRQEFIRMIEKSGERMLNTIQDIVDISKIEAGQTQVFKKQININKHVIEIYELFDREAGEKGLELSCTNGLPDEEAFVETDETKFHSILTNLIKNAIKYTDSGKIHFGYESNNAKLQFYVKDTGLGIPEEKQDVIFERFMQADIEDKEARQGSGLGLAITKAFVELLGGEIWLESTPGEGSEFYFTLPYSRQDTEVTSKESKLPTAENGYDGHKHKFLMVEDDEVSTQLLTIICEPYASEILTAKTGMEAIEACQKHSDIDVVLMDIQLPDLNGYEATRRIREFNKEVHIIAQTAFALVGDRKKAIEAGCDDYITKPINADQLNKLLSIKHK